LTDDVWPPFLDLLSSRVEEPEFSRQLWRSGYNHHQSACVRVAKLFKIEQSLAKSGLSSSGACDKVRWKWEPCVLGAWWSETDPASDPDNGEAIRKQQGKAVDRVRLKTRLLEELLKLLADRPPKIDSLLDLLRRKRFARIVSLIARLKTAIGSKSYRVISRGDPPVLSSHFAKSPAWPRARPNVRDGNLNDVGSVGDPCNPFVAPLPRKTASLW